MDVQRLARDAFHDPWVLVEEPTVPLLQRDVRSKDDMWRNLQNRRIDGLFTAQTHGAARALTAPHLPFITYHIHHHKGHWGIIVVISWTLPRTPARLCMESGSLGPYRRRKHTGSALIHGAHSRPLIHLPRRPEQSAPSSFPPCPDILSVAICPPTNADKGVHHSPIYQSTLNYLKVPSHRWLDSLNLYKTYFFFYLLQTYS